MWQSGSGHERAWKQVENTGLDVDYRCVRLLANMGGVAELGGILPQLGVMVLN